LFTRKFEEISKNFTNYQIKLQKPNNGELLPVEELLLAMHRDVSNNSFVWF